MNWYEFWWAKIWVQVAWTVIVLAVLVGPFVALMLLSVAEEKVKRIIWKIRSRWHRGI